MWHKDGSMVRQVRIELESLVNYSSLLTIAPYDEIPKFAIHDYFINFHRVSIKRRIGQKPFIISFRYSLYLLKKSAKYLIFEKSNKNQLINEL